MWDKQCHLLLTGTPPLSDNTNFGKKYFIICKFYSVELVQAPSNFIAGRPKAALLFWFFGGFRCGVPLFIVILVIFI